MIRALTAVVLALGLVGCATEEDHRRAREATAASFAHPIELGQLPDGRKVSYVVHHQVTDGGSNQYRYIYLIQGTNATSVGYTLPQGKAQIDAGDATVELPLLSEADRKVLEAKRLLQEADALYKQNQR